MSHQERHTDDARQAVAELLRGRRTLSRFATRPVPEQLIEEAIELARWAPNHYLTEPWHFYRLGPESVKNTVEWVRARATEAKGEEMGRRKARRAEGVPAWVVVTCRESEDPVTRLEDYAATSCAIHNMALYLWQAGVGMKWCTGSMAHSGDYLATLGLDPADEFIVGILRIGYPISLPTQKRRSVDEVSTLLP